jgi:hypothetical protein
MAGAIWPQLPTGANMIKTIHETSRMAVQRDPCD